MSTGIIRKFGSLYYLSKVIPYVLYFIFLGLVWFQSFTVHIRDADDPPDDIILVAGSVDESAAPNSFVGSLNVVDQDSSSFYMCTIIRQTPNDALKIDFGTALIVNDASVIDYELYQQIALWISCTDSFSSIERNFTLPIRDNDDSFFHYCDVQSTHTGRFTSRS